MATRYDKIPDWLLERFAAGDLSERQAKETRERLAAQGEEPRLAALAASNAEILAALPPERVVPEIERRAAARARKASRAVPLLGLSAVATCTAGLLAILALRVHHGTVAMPSPAQESIGIRGLAPSLRVHRKTKAGSELLAPRARVRKGDTLQLGYVAAGRRFGVIASIDARGTVTLHLPESPGPAAGLEPNGERALAHAFELDDAPGFERFVFVTGDAPFHTADVAAALTSGPPLSDSLSAFEIILKKETP